MVNLDAAKAAPPETADVNTSSRWVLIFGTSLIVLLFGTGVLWASLASISGAVIGSGSVTVVGQPKTLQHLDGGIVSEILVSDGDVVEQGDPVLRLDATRLVAAEAATTQRLLDAVSLRDRLIAERDMASSITFDRSLLDELGIAADPAIEQAQTALFDVRRLAVTGQVDLLERNIVQLTRQAQGLETLLASAERQLEIVRDERAGVATLEPEGLTTSNRVSTLERQVEQARGQITQTELELGRTSSEIARTRIEIAQVDHGFQEQVRAELRQVEDLIAQTTFEIRSITDQLQRIEVTAPIDGIVHNLSIFTVGGVVSSGEPIMQIVPQDAEFIVVAQIEPQFVDNVFEGQPATMRFSAFNMRTTPEVNSTVDHVSPDATVDERTGMSFYRIQVEVGPDEISQLGDVTIVPGMPVDVFVNTGDRSPLSYLTGPLTEFFMRTWREP